jgi:hypothetical protein
MDIEGCSRHVAGLPEGKSHLAATGFLFHKAMLRADRLIDSGGHDHRRHSRL